MIKKWLPHIIAVTAFVVFIVLGLASASTPEPSSKSISSTGETAGNSPTQQQQQQTKSQQVQTASQYWTGNGGKGMRLGILVPQSQGLNENQDYLPTLIQGVLVSNFSKYSGISVLDRVSLDKVITETLDLTYEDDLDIVRLGRVAQVGYMMTGNIIKTSTGFSLQINVTDTTPQGNTLASYSGTCTAAELDNHTAIHRASLELLSQMNVQLNARARSELARASDQETVNVQTALARGITAQREGMDVEALSYFLQANSYGTGMEEIEKRLNIVSASITGNNVGANARNEIAWRRQWIERLQETENFYRNYTKDNPPYYLVYDTDIKQGTINFQTETVELSFGLRLIPDAMWVHTINDVILTVENALKSTEKAESWGLDWPNNVVSMTSPFADRANNFIVISEIINDQGRSIGRQTATVPYGYIVRYGMTIPKRQWQGTVSFPNVDTKLITDRLSIRIVSIDGIPVENAARQKRISIIPSNELGSIVRPGGIAATSETFFTISDDGTITGYNGNQPNLVIPSMINGIWVIKIGKDVFKSKGLTSVTIPNGVRIIDANAFYNNDRLTSVIIANSVTYIGESAFKIWAYSNQVRNITIGAGVDIRETAFGEITDNAFVRFYNQNGKKAGKYSGTGGGFNEASRWTYSPR